jgi:hypothetical protein
MKKNTTEIQRIIQELYSDDEMNYPKKWWRSSPLW